ncbi:MAG: carbohydrate kinase family protein [Bacillota bacterium]
MGSIVVIGGSNIDLKGYSENYLPNTSNPGHIEESLGGVGRNIAENLGILGNDVIFLTSVGDDHFGKKLIEETSSSQVNLDYVKVTNKEKTGLYLAHLDEHGELIAAISGMEIMNSIDKLYIKENEEIIKNSSLVIFDTNLNYEVIEYILQITKNNRIITFGEPVSIDKGKKLVKQIKNIDYLSPNLDEAEMLLGLKINKEDDFSLRLNRIKEKYNSYEKFPVMFVSCGEKGVLILSKGKDDFVKAEKISEEDLEETTGAGDALVAGIASKLVRERNDFEKAVEFGIKIASLTVKSKFTVNPNLKEKIKEIKGEE